MATREIVNYPNEILEQKAQRVERIDADIQTLIDDMIETMRNAPGVGLAAPQVNVPLRVVVIEYGEPENEDEEPAEKQLFTLINPEISRMSREKEMGTEGCLSFPGILAEVERSLGVTVVAQDRNGDPLKIKAEGWLARIFQHEIDHLNGVLFTERAQKVYEIKPDEETEQDPSAA
ncbi:MAG: peptide deformylase [Anaerolineales bacterium]|nr:MAG: peptide deformylase [Anaerolineales bacterium]